MPKGIKKLYTNQQRNEMRFSAFFFCNIFIALFNLASSQDYVTFNQGKTGAKDYFLAIEYETINKFIIIEGIIKGKTRRFLFDTGASCMISQKLFDELNSPSILGEIAVYDSNQLVNTNKVISLNHIILGGIEFNNIPTIVNDNDSNIIFNCLEIDGIIGSNLLRNSIIQISSKEHIIYITDNPKKLDLEKKKSSPIILASNQSSPYLWITIQNKRKRKVQVLFDSGANSFLSLSLRHFNAFNKRRIPYEILSTAKGNSNIGLHGLANDTSIFRLKSHNLLLNQSVFTNVSFETTMSNSSKIGVELIEYGVVSIDYIHKKFYFEPFFAEKKDLNMKFFPVSPMVKGKKYVIGIVWNEELKNKINVGDQIIAINNQDYENIAICDILKQSSTFPEKDEMSITLKNEKGIINTLILTRKYIDEK